jgi:hypothetical protein
MQLGSFGNFLLITLVIVVGFGFLANEYLDLRVDNQELGRQVATLEAERQRLIAANNTSANQHQQDQAEIGRLQKEIEVQRVEFQRLIEQRAVVCPAPVIGGQGEQIAVAPVTPPAQTYMKAGRGWLTSYGVTPRWLIGLSLASLLLVGVVFLGIHPRNRQSSFKRATTSGQKRPMTKRLQHNH